MAEFGVALLGELDEADELALGLDHERVLLTASLGQPPEIRLVRSAPPSNDAWLGLDLDDRFDIACLQRSEQDVSAAKEQSGTDPSRVQPRERIIATGSEDLGRFVDEQTELSRTRCR